MSRKKILFLADYAPDTVPGQRFRFEQYFSFLEENGFECELSPILSPLEVKQLYQKGNLLRKAWVILKGLLHRSKDVLKANEFDIIFIFREAFIAGPVFFETLLKRSKAAIVYDFDDAIWIENVSDANKRFALLKNAGKIPSIIRKSDMVFAGNRYLAEYASTYCKNIKIIPTTIDTNKYFGKENKKNKICIGWSGSITTIQHFELAIPFLLELKKKYQDSIYFKVIGDANYVNRELDIRGIAWSQKTEIEDLQEIDIGIMPLRDDEWAKGKCGLKGLQYMALEIPTGMSPVGVNTEIIQSGVNGFLASSNEEWVQKLSELIDSSDLRKRLGKAGRQTVIERYSVEANKSKYLDYLKEALKQKNIS